MLNPDHRRLYTDALRPPLGFRFGEAVAATYSLNLDTLLTIPLHLALFSAEEPLEDLLRDGVALLESLRRTTDHVTVYGQAAAVLAPGRPHVLYGLLEPTVVEVMAPADGGLFHPKLWLIRFDHPESGEARLRLLVLSRNITADSCWDLVLTLDGEPGDTPREENVPLHDLVRRLPEIALRRPPPQRVEQARDLAELALLTRWEVPDPFDRVRFHVLGLGGRATWLPEESGRLAVISPFLTRSALNALADSTGDPRILVSRPEELATIDPAVLERFGRVMVLAEQAELEDGEEAAPPPGRQFPSHGLHAKAYIADRRAGHMSYTHMYVGSANATWPALIGGTSVELMAELIGKRNRVGAVEDLLDVDALGGVLTAYERPDDAEPPDPAVAKAQEALEDARRDLATAGLRIVFAATEGGWSAELVPARPVRLEGVSSIRAWFVTRKPETASDVGPLTGGVPAPLEPTLVQHATSFVTFALTADAADETIRFVLALEADGLPVAERDAAIVRDVIRNREGFLRYVLLLLAEAGEGDDVFGAGAGSWSQLAGTRGAHDDLPVFEHLTRAFCRQPERLESIRRLMEEIGVHGDGDVVPPEFLRLWEVFRSAMPAEGETADA